MKKTMNKKDAIALADSIRAKYPQHIFLEDIIDSALADNVFKNANEMMICWGIFMKTMPRRVGA